MWTEYFVPQDVDHIRVLVNVAMAIDIKKRWQGI
jgi:hypothetical protein